MASTVLTTFSFFSWWEQVPLGWVDTESGCMLRKTIQPEMDSDPPLTTWKQAFWPLCHLTLRGGILHWKLLCSCFWMYSCFLFPLNVTLNCYPTVNNADSGWEYTRKRTLTVLTWVVWQTYTSCRSQAQWTDIFAIFNYALHSHSLKVSIWICWGHR